MKAMLLHEHRPIDAGSRPLQMASVPDPEPAAGEVLIQVTACGVCHTELDEIEGRLPPPYLPVILGHQVVGHIVGCGEDVSDACLGQRVGVAWIFSACGECDFCRVGNENLCPSYQATGCDVNGGYAELMTVPAAFAHPLPDVLSDSEAAPLLCAGAIGYRSLRLTGLVNGQRLGLTGFGASGHLVLKMVRYRYPDMSVYVFARNPDERAFALEMGAVWAGDTADQAPEFMDAIIDTTPVWKPVVEALTNLAPGGRLVINAIRKEENDQEQLLRLDYPTHLWQEKEIKSVANVTRADVAEFLALAADAGIRPEVEEYELTDANRALVELKMKQVRGAKILQVG